MFEGQRPGVQFNSHTRQKRKLNEPLVLAYRPTYPALSQHNNNNNNNNSSSSNNNNNKEEKKEEQSCSPSTVGNDTLIATT